MQLAERHIIKKNNSFFKEIDAISFLSKNLYNKANYIVRQEFINTSKEKESGKRDKANWIRYNKLQKQLQNEKDFDYKQLPAKVSQHVLKLLDKNWISFFKSIKDYSKNPSKYTGQPSLPKYKHKKDGRNILIYTIQAISKKELKNSVVLLSGTNIKIRTKQNINNIQQVRVVPKINNYVIEIIYNKQEVKNENLDKTKIAGIDLGLNNLATVTSNQNNVKPLLINGRPLKSINQYYNKKRAKLQSFVGDKSSNRLIILTNKRNRKVDNYLHNASRFIVNYLVSNNFGTIVIGHNKQWKTEINIGHKNNQEFVNIPHSRFIEMIKYKCELVGIEVIITEESYTSKCSFIDVEEMKHQENYIGKRKHRGLFISKNGIKINADCNGSGNIIRKVFPTAFDGYGIQGVVVHPIRRNPYKQVA
jgi:IS605 OrfB family transposase